MSAIQVIYSPVNQGYFILWFNHLLSVQNTLEDVEYYLDFLARQ